ncbi:MAG: hypothetical protein KC766_00795 [Myxococcales bacterium]|nr:hypothetical protein [Myxococcales bacterium]
MGEIDTNTRGPRLGAASMLIAMLALAPLLSGCGRPKAEQCGELRSSLIEVEKLRLSFPRAAAERKARYDELLDAKRRLGELKLSDAGLDALRRAEMKNQEDYVFALKDIDRARVYSELSAATAKMQRIGQQHDENLDGLVEQCGTVATPAGK